MIFFISPWSVINALRSYGNKNRIRVKWGNAPPPFHVPLCLTEFIGKKDYKGLQRTKKGFKGLLRATKGYKGLLRATKGYKGLQRATKG